MDYGQPSIKDFSCRDSLASTPIMKTTGSFLTLRYSSDTKLKHGDGFKLVITAVYEASMWECPADYAVCRNNLCISRSLYCDDINHCLDNSDESNCSRGGGFTDDLSISNAVVIIVVLVLIVFASVIIILLTIYCRRDDDHYTNYQHHLQRMGVPLHPSSSVMFSQYQYLPVANMSPYMTSMPQARMPHGYSTLPINLARHMNSNVNKNNLTQSPMNGPYVMMTGIPSQAPLPMIIQNPQDSIPQSTPKFQHPNKQQHQQSPQHSQQQAYNMVLMGSGTNQH